jgi:hypothetical protein
MACVRVGDPVAGSVVTEEVCPTWPGAVDGSAQFLRKTPYRGREQVTENQPFGRKRLEYRIRLQELIGMASSAALREYAIRFLRACVALAKNRSFDSFSTIAQLFLTSMLVCIGYLQYKVYTQQAVIMNGQSSITREVERPFVVADTAMQYRGARTADGKINYEFWTNWENTGHTSTHKFITYTARVWDIDAFDSAGNFRENDPVGENFCVRPGDITSSIQSFLGPGQKFESARAEVDLDQLISVRDRKAMIYVAGIAQYESRFSEPQAGKHFTQFCRLVDHIIGDPSRLELGLNISFRFCKKHNCADDECNKCP